MSDEFVALCRSSASYGALGGRIVTRRDLYPICTQAGGEADFSSAALWRVRLNHDGILVIAARVRTLGTNACSIVPAGIAAPSRIEIVQDFLGVLDALM